jgi:uncharacterized membrane protein YeaQ/YmgE (transglycosylase-associated protein family)
MELIIIVLAMAVVGLIMAYIAGFIWKDERPVGVPGDYIVGVVTAIVVGFLDWYLIPAMGFSEGWKYVGIATEPALSVLLVLWIIKKARD